MIPATVGWLNAATQGTSTPVQLLTIYNSSDSVLTTLSRERPSPAGPVSAHHWINSLSGGGSKGDILSGSGTNSPLNVGLLDMNKAVTQLLASTTLEGLTATLASGFSGLGLSDFLPLGTYIINEVKTDKSNLRYNLSLRDPGIKLQNLAYLVGDDGWPTADGHQHTVQGNPMAILTELLEGECGYASSQLNAPAIANYQNNLFTGTIMTFHLAQSPQAQAWAQQELFAPLAGYGFWNYAGKYTPYYPLPLGVVSPAGALTMRNIKSPVPTLSAGPFVGSLAHMLDYNGSGYLNAVMAEYPPAITAYGLPELTTKQSRGLRSADGGVLLCRWAQAAIFRRYGLKPRLLTVRCFWPQVVFELGDVVSVTHPFIPDKTTGLGLANHWYEVTGKSINWDADGHGACEPSYDLLDVNWLNAPALQVAPNGTPNWAGSTAPQQEQYGYVEEGQLIY
jgi:hypothetical protein